MRWDRFFLLLVSNPMNTPPVILLAFANEKTEGRFLHTLKDEIAALRKALQPAEDAGLCEIVLLPNATTEEILDGVTAGSGCGYDKMHIWAAETMDCSQSGPVTKAVPLAVAQAAHSTG